MVRPWSVSLTISQWVKDDEAPANPTDPIRIGQKSLPEETIILDQANAKKNYGFCFMCLLYFFFFVGGGGVQIFLCQVKM